MKLPDFEVFEPFLDLKKRMDARAPVEFSAEFSARQISNDNFAAAETIAMPELGDFVVERTKPVFETPSIEVLKSEIAEPLVETIDRLPELETNLDVVADVVVPEPAQMASEPDIKPEPKSRAKLRPARKKIKQKEAKLKKERPASRSTLVLTLTASMIIILNAVLLWAFFGYLASLSDSKEEPKPQIAQPQTVQDLPKKLEEVPPKPVQAMPEIPPVPAPKLPEPKLAEPEPPMPVTIPSEPELAKPQAQPPAPEPELQQAPQPIPSPAESLHAAPPPAVEELPPVQPLADAPLPTASEAMSTQAPANVTVPEHQETIVSIPPENPRPSIFDGQDSSGLPPAGGIGGVGAGWDGQGKGKGEKPLASVGGIGGIGTPVVAPEKVAKPKKTNLRFRRVYVRHYVPLEPPPEDIPADQLPWEKP